MNNVGRPRIIRWTLGLRGHDGARPPGSGLGARGPVLFGNGKRGSVLRGEWLGHAVHPLLTDVVLGTWTSAHVLDLFGGPTPHPRLRSSSAPACWPPGRQRGRDGPNGRQPDHATSGWGSSTRSPTVQRSAPTRHHGLLAGGAGTARGSVSRLLGQSPRESARTWVAISQRHARWRATTLPSRAFPGNVVAGPRKDPMTMPVPGSGYPPGHE